MTTLCPPARSGFQAPEVMEAGVGGIGEVTTGVGASGTSAIATAVIIATRTGRRAAGWGYRLVGSLHAAGRQVGERQFGARRFGRRIGRRRIDRAEQPANRLLDNLDRSAAGAALDGR